MSDDEDLIDFIEFSNIKYKTSQIASYYQDKYDILVNNVAEKLLMSNIAEINGFTTCIQLDKLNDLSKYKVSVKKLFIHLNIYKPLTSADIINWNKGLASLYPIKTLGDGNCLVSIIFRMAVLNSIFVLYTIQQK
jgi:hypothetical protein